mgnify:CR=1 FL=1
MIILVLIIVYVLFGFLTYEFVSFSKKWPDVEDIFMEEKNQEHINRMVISVAFWPVWIIIGIGVCIFYTIKAILWFFKKLYIALRDIIMSAVDAANKNIKIVK